MNMKNSNLHAAKKAKNDEFYTQLTDIEKELKYYKTQFTGKVVYCNCDDARDSNFFKYFSMNFEYLGLKKLICTGYKENGKGVVLVYEGDKNGNKRVDDEEIIVKELEGNGDFRSPECIEFLKESDIVVSNPPFSLARDYFKQLMDYDKKFLVIGNKNAFTYKEIFPYIKEGKLRTGRCIPQEFKLPDDTISKQVAGLCRWFTNLETHKADSPVPIYMKYKGNESKFPEYDNYSAIDCSKIADFPIDLPIGAIVGVPITIIDKIADDGFIYFDDGGVSGEEQKYGIEWTTDRGGDGHLDDIKKPCDRYDAPVIAGGEVQENPYQAYQVIDARLVAKNIAQQKKGTMMIKDKDSAINGKATYARVAIKRIR